LSSCDASKELPSRAVHAEANAIAQAAKHGIATAGASIYVTLEPCLSCLKLSISAGIREIFYETPSNSGKSAVARDMFIKERLIKMEAISLSKEVKAHATIALELGFNNSP
jgi:dCMP deaminase